MGASTNKWLIVLPGIDFGLISCSLSLDMHWLNIQPLNQMEEERMFAKRSINYRTIEYRESDLWSIVHRRH